MKTFIAVVVWHIVFFGVGVLSGLRIWSEMCDEGRAVRWGGKTYTCQPEPVRKVEKLVL